MGYLHTVQQNASHAQSDRHPKPPLLLMEYSHPRVRVPLRVHEVEIGFRGTSCCEGATAKRICEAGARRERRGLKG